MGKADKHGLSGARAEHSLMDQGAQNAVKRQNGNPEGGIRVPVRLPLGDAGRASSVGWG
jgi:hypothetical protein